MTLKARLLEDLTGAMRARDSVRLSTLRLVKARIQEAEVERRASEGRDYELDDAGVIAVLKSCAKQRRDAIDSYEAAGRPERAAGERAELAIIESYLPEPMSREEIVAAVRRVIDETGASSMRDMGAVMQAAMARLGDAADGKAVNQVARELLAGK